MNAIFTRRSIRQYQSKEVPEEDLKKILEAGMCAPSAGNEKPWHFIVVKDKEMLRKLSDTSPYAKMTEKAPLAIVVCGDLDLEVYKGYWVQDCSAATENMLIEVQHLGLGAVWLGVYPLNDRVTYIRELFGMKEHIVPFAIIPVGYPAEEKAFANRYDQSRVHYETWNPAK